MTGTQAHAVEMYLGECILEKVSLIIVLSLVLRWVYSKEGMFRFHIPQQKWLPTKNVIIWGIPGGAGPYCLLWLSIMEVQLA